MALIQAQSPSESVLVQITEVYKSPHVDSQEERQNSLRIIEHARKSGVSDDVLLAKARQASTAHTKFKYKLSALIAGRYWEQTYEQTRIVGRGYQLPETWNPPSGEEFSLKP